MKIAACALIAVAVTIGAVHGQTPAPDPVKVAAGAALYTAQKCGQCHMIKTVGGKLAGALDGIGTRRTAAELKKWFSPTTAAELEAKLPKKPVVTMSGWLKTHKLTDADIDNLVAYMASLK